MTDELITNPAKFANYVVASVLTRVNAGEIPATAWEIDAPNKADDRGTTPYFTYYATDIGALRVVLRRSTSTEIHWGYSAEILGGPQRDLSLGCRGTDDPHTDLGRLVDAVAKLIDARLIDLRRQAITAFGE